MLLCSFIGLSFILAGATALALPMADLQQKTLKAFEEYVSEFEKNIDAAVSGEKPFLWLHSQDPDHKNHQP